MYTSSTGESERPAALSQFLELLKLKSAPNRQQQLAS
jgi:hypothetical protein